MLVQQVGQTCFDKRTNRLLQNLLLRRNYVECWCKKFVQHVGTTSWYNKLDKHVVVNLLPRSKFCNSRFVRLSIMLVHQVGTTCWSNFLCQHVGPTFHSEFAPQKFRKKSDILKKLKKRQNKIVTPLYYILNFKSWYSCSRVILSLLEKLQIKT